MAKSQPVALCALVLPSGKRCGGPALRNTRFCRHHTPGYQNYTRDRILDEILNRLHHKLDRMDLPELLFFLHGRLERLQQTFNRFPEVRFTLTYVLDRLDSATATQNGTTAQLPRNLSFAHSETANSNEMQDIVATLLKSIS